MQRNSTNPPRFQRFQFFSYITAVFLLAATLGGLFLEGLYRDSLYVEAQAQGQDLVTLVLVIPVFVIATLLLNKNKTGIIIVWLGCLLYNIYSYMLYCVMARYNDFFLLYVATFALSLYLFIFALIRLEPFKHPLSLSSRAAAKAVAIYHIVVGILFVLLWLSQIITGLFTGTTPASVALAGTPIVYVMDLGWFLPALILTGILTLRKHTLGVLFLGIVLVKLFTLGFAIIGMVWFMQRAGIPQQGATGIVFLILPIISLIMMFLYFRNVTPKEYYNV
jgi:hypothetical protein